MHLITMVANRRQKSKRRRRRRGSISSSKCENAADTSHRTVLRTETVRFGLAMATATLQSFNVFLTERLTAAAVDIYGFVEKTINGYQEEVHRAKMENQRLQRLLDLVYKPEIRLHRAGMFHASTLPRVRRRLTRLILGTVSKASS